MNSENKYIISTIRSRRTNRNMISLLKTKVYYPIAAYEKQKYSHVTQTTDY